MSRVLLHNILIAFSHLAPSKDKLASAFDESKFSEKLQEFHEQYAQINPNGKTTFNTLYYL